MDGEKSKKQGVDTEAEVFLKEMEAAGVRALKKEGKVPRPKEKIQRVELTDDEDALQSLEDLVAGKGSLNFDFSDEYVEGRARDFPHSEFDKLKRGDFAVQASLDLHGLVKVEAKEKVEKFFEEARRNSWRCIHIICGRGLRSPGGKPVLKEYLVRWLLHGKLSQEALGFCSAPTSFGGVGAVFILLRKKRAI